MSGKGAIAYKLPHLLSSCPKLKLSPSPEIHPLSIRVRQAANFKMISRNFLISSGQQNLGGGRSVAKKKEQRLEKRNEIQEFMLRRINYILIVMCRERYESHEEFKHRREWSSVGNEKVGRLRSESRIYEFCWGCFMSFNYSGS